MQTPTDQVTFTAEDVEQREASPVSMMPEGLLEALTAAEVRDLIAYLSGPGQVPPPGR